MRMVSNKKESKVKRKGESLHVKYVVTDASTFTFSVTIKKSWYNNAGFLSVHNKLLWCLTHEILLHLRIHSL